MDCSSQYLNPLDDFTLSEHYDGLDFQTDGFEVVDDQPWLYSALDWVPPFPGADELGLPPTDNANIHKRSRAEPKKVKPNSERRVAFRMLSEREDLDDGFRWRKYGKKSVKTNPNPRNYYKCSIGGCLVKKRVERDKDDGRFIVVTYDGVHNHVSPTAATAVHHFSFSDQSNR